MGSPPTLLPPPAGTASSSSSAPGSTAASGDTLDDSDSSDGETIVLGREGVERLRHSARSPVGVREPATRHKIRADAPPWRQAPPAEMLPPPPPPPPGVAPEWHEEVEGCEDIEYPYDPACEESWGQYQGLWCGSYGGYGGGGFAPQQQYMAWQCWMAQMAMKTQGPASRPTAAWQQQQPGTESCTAPHCAPPDDPLRCLAIHPDWTADRISETIDALERARGGSVPQEELQDIIADMLAHPPPPPPPPPPLRSSQAAPAMP